MIITKTCKKKGNTMSKIGNVNLLITEIAEDLGIENDPANFTEDEKAAVKAELETIIKTNSCEADCPHKQALGLL